MEEVIYLNELYDFYGSLLTDKQRDYFENYYFNNLSLGEMAENYGVSRNAIHKQLKIVEERLKHYEENLELLEKSKKAEELVQKINDKKLRDEILELF
ncbi:MAG: YlxM family DNA-binding protein [Bacilli bacterium]